MHALSTLSERYAIFSTHTKMKKGQINSVTTVQLISYWHTSRSTPGQARYPNVSQIRTSKDCRCKIFSSLDAFPVIQPTASKHMHKKAYHTCESPGTAVCSTRTYTRCISSQWRRKCRGIQGTAGFSPPSPNWTGWQRGLRLQSQCLPQLTLFMAHMSISTSVLPRWQTNCEAKCEQKQNNKWSSRSYTTDNHSSRTMIY